jgi:hypothetical protein
MKSAIVGLELEMGGGGEGRGFISTQLTCAPMGDAECGGSINQFAKMDSLKHASWTDRNWGGHVPNWHVPTIHEAIFNHL